MNLLGNTLDKIAFEKAGIIKQHIPAVIGEALAETRPVFEQKAKELQAPIVFAEEQWSVEEAILQNSLLTVTVKNQQTHTVETYSLDLPGLYQTKNLCTVLTAVEQLQQSDWYIKDEHVHTALSHTKKINGLHGRWELLQQHPTIVLDVGHNEDGVKQIVHQLNNSSFRQLHIIIGMVKDKEIDKVLALLPKQATYYFTKAQIPRALDEPTLKEKAKNYCLNGETFADVNLALASAKEKAAKEDMILVCGSVFLVGEVARPVSQNL
jgi:dihydrofolate synthase / folylpolyglutamate synthase